MKLPCENEDVNKVVVKTLPQLYLNVYLKLLLPSNVQLFSLQWQIKACSSKECMSPAAFYARVLNQNHLMMRNDDYCEISQDVLRILKHNTNLSAINIKLGEFLTIFLKSVLHQRPNKTSLLSNRKMCIFIVWLHLIQDTKCHDGEKKKAWTCSDNAQLQVLFIQLPTSRWRCLSRVLVGKLVVTQRRVFPLVTLMHKHIKYTNFFGISCRSNIHFMCCLRIVWQANVSRLCPY